VSELVKVFNGTEVKAREADRYVDATALCKAAGKKWSDYWRLDGTKAVIQAIAESTGIPVDSMVIKQSGRGGGTWIHPEVVIHFAMWADAKFAAQVVKWARELLTTGKVELRPPASDEMSLCLADVRSFVKALDDRSRERESRLAELETRLEGALASLPPAPHSVNVGPLWTVRDILNEAGWFTASARQRAEIRDNANRMIRLHTHQEVEKLNGHSVYTRAQVPFVDKAIRIERMRARLAEEERGLGLFASAPEVV
jgi:hypothetical protein